MRYRFLSIVLQFIIFHALAQEQVYFNNIYQHANNFAVGMTILETEDGYIGYGGTEDPSNIGQMLLFFKIDKEGNELIWKPFGENNHSYYFGNVGGAMIKTNDGNFAMACHIGYNQEAYSTLIKFDQNLDTLWKRNYHPVYYTVVINCIQTNDGGYILIGWVWFEGESFSDIVLLKTDSLGNYQWHHTYGNTLADQGETVIETPDGGYLIGGFRYDPASPYYNTLDALVIKTDSLGNQQWLKTYGNPYVDDDMALVSMDDDGNYLFATIYGEWNFSTTYRIGRPCIYKINSSGQVVGQKKVGPSRMNSFIRNFRNSDDNFILTGYSYQTDTFTTAIETSWIMKLDVNYDSIWYRDYTHYALIYDDNYLYDVNYCQDKGFIAVGEAYPDMAGTTQKMWIIKVDSMGCDTPGCATGTQVFNLPVDDQQELLVWPNPTSGSVTLSLSKCEAKGLMTIRVFNAQGMKVDEIEIPAHTESISLDAARWNRGLYFLWVTCGDMVYSAKLVVK